MGIKAQTRFSEDVFRKSVLKNLVVEQTKRLEKYASQELNEMAKTHTFTNRTYNLQDSLVWGLFFDGTLRSYGFYGGGLAKKPSRYHKEKINGRELAEKYIHSYQPSVSSGWEIVWAAVAPYAQYLDPMAGATRSNHFYVITQRYDAIKNTLEPKCKVTFRA